MADDLRQRYEAAIRARCPMGLTLRGVLDAVLDARDEELEAARAAAEAELRGGLDSAQLAVQWQERAEKAEAALTRSDEECAALRTQLTAARMALKGAEAEALAVGAARETAQATIARMDALHRPKETRLTTLCIDHNSVAHVRTVSVTEVEECRRCHTRPALTCSNITCCQWPCAVHLALHDETEEECQHHAR